MKAIIRKMTCMSFVRESVEVNYKHIILTFSLHAINIEKSEI